MKNIFITIIFTFSFLFSEPILHSTFKKDSRDDPMEERAIGYLLEGVAKTAVSNYGNYITWGEFPNGLWGEYTYIPSLGLMLGVPGYLNSSKMEWFEVEGSGGEFDCRDGDQAGITWYSYEAYQKWQNESFAGVVFDVEDDRGDIGYSYSGADLYCEIHRWNLDSFEESLEISLPNGIDPNLSSAKVGLAYPWSIRPTLSTRLEEYDEYNYGVDGIPWTDDDEYMYYGANTAESWFARSDGHENWQASIGSNLFTHNWNSPINAGDLFGDTPFTDPDDTSTLLAHSTYLSTWPLDPGDPEGGSFQYWP